MMAVAPAIPNRRVAAAVAAVAIEALLGYALIFGFALTLPARPDGELALFDIAPPPPPPPPPVPHRIASRRPEGAAAPPNLRSQATEIVAPAPIVPVILPPPVVAAPVKGVGIDPSAGAADVPGPGTGAGGEGNGTGGGGRGNGDGDGGGGFTPPRWIRGRLRDSDFPRAIGEAGQGGTVSVRYTVETDGRVGRCVVTRSSGNAELDRITCDLIVQRFRYRPSLDPSGRPVRSQVVEDHTWVSVDEEESDRGRRDED